jgi:hypothetical protein
MNRSFGQLWPDGRAATYRRTYLRVASSSQPQHRIKAEVSLSAPTPLRITISRETGRGAIVIRQQARPSGIPAAAAIGAGDDLQKVAIGVLEIDTAPGIVMIDLTLLRLRRISPIGQCPLADPTEDLVEI